MYCLGVRRNVTLSAPRASRSRSRWRIFSRSSATDLMRLLKVSGASSGIARVSTVAIAPIAANTIARKRVSLSFSINRSSMAPASEIEVDHLAHDENADRHPGGGAHEHHPPHRMGP